MKLQRFLNTFKIPHYKWTKEIFDTRSTQVLHCSSPALIPTVTLCLCPCFSSDGYTIIPPNESKRNEMKTSNYDTNLIFIYLTFLSKWMKWSVVVAAVAQKEEEALNRWKETQRVPSVCVNPERLGNLSLPSTTFTISIFIFTSSLTDIWHSDLLSRWWCHTGWSQAKTANKSSIHETAEESTCQVIHSGNHPFIFCGALHISKYYSKLFTHTIFVCCHKLKKRK